LEQLEHEEGATLEDIVVVGANRSLAKIFWLPLWGWVKLILPHMTTLLF